MINLYMAVYHTFLPKSGVDTRRSGWMTDGLERVERIEIVDRLPNRVLRHASFVLDIINMTMHSNRTAVNADETIRTYTQKYAEKIATGVEKCLNMREAKNAKK